MRTLKFAVLLMIAALFANGQQVETRVNGWDAGQKLESIQNELNSSVAVSQKSGANQTTRAPLCSTGNSDIMSKEAHGNVSDIVSGRNYVTIAIVNHEGIPLQEVFTGGKTFVRNLCPGAIIHVKIDRSFFSKKRPHVLQLYAVDADGNTYSSEPVSFDSSTDLMWSVGENDAKGPMSAWQHRVAERAIKEGYDPELEVANRQQAQQAGWPGSVVAESQSYGDGYGGNFNPYIYNPGTVMAGGAVYSGNVAVMQPGVGYYGATGYNPAYEYYHGTGTSYVPNSCGSIFAPATWPYCNQRVGYGYDRPILRGVHGGISARIGVGF
jgi:hypothetical protein